MANDLTIRDEKAIDIRPLGELQVGSQAATALQEIQGAIFLAKQFPRDDNRCFGKLMESCKRETLAQKANYSFPRGGSNVSGPSVVLARVAQQCYGNMRSGGPDILRDDDESVLIECWAWDIENNVRISMQDSFKKLIQRKINGKTTWVKPDERDLRELINRRGAILERNCILKALPRDLIEDAQAVCRKTIKGGIKDPKGEQKRLIMAFSDYNVSVEQLQEYVGSEDWTADHLVELQEVFTAIKDGVAKPSEYFSKKEEPPKPTDPPKQTMTTGTLKKGDPKNHQGYESGSKPEAPLPEEPLSNDTGNTRMADAIKSAVKSTAVKAAEAAEGIDDYVTAEQVAELESICDKRKIEPAAVRIFLQQFYQIEGGFEKMPAEKFDTIKRALTNVSESSINNLKDVKPELFK